MYKISTYLDQDHRRCDAYFEHADRLRDLMRQHSMKEEGSELFNIICKRDGVRVHRLIDDTHYATRTRQPEIRRDPMVAALFGNAPASRDAGEAASDATS